MRGRNEVSSRDGETSKLRLRRRAGWEEEVGFATSVASDDVREEVVGGMVTVSWTTGWWRRKMESRNCVGKGDATEGETEEEKDDWRLEVTE